MRIMDSCLDDWVIAIDLFVLDRYNSVEARGLSGSGPLVLGENHHQIPRLHSNVECPARRRVGREVLALLSKLIVGKREIVLGVGVNRLEIDGVMVLARNADSQRVVSSNAANLPARGSFGSSLARRRSQAKPRLAVLIYGSLAGSTETHADSRRADWIGLHVRLRIALILRAEDVTPTDVCVIPEDGGLRPADLIVDNRIIVRRVLRDGRVFGRCAVGCGWRCRRGSSGHRGAWGIGGRLRGCRRRRVLRGWRS